MSKIKILDLMKKKELVSRQSASDVVGKLNAELEKCRRVTNDIDEIARQKSSFSKKSDCYSFQSDRQLLLKLMEQKEILLNRQEFLSDEKQSASGHLSNIQKKIEYLESKRVQAEAEARSKRLADWEDSQQNKKIP